MKKRNPFLAQLEAKKIREMQVQRIIVRQEMKDFAQIALNRAFGFGEVNQKKFSDALDQVCVDVAKMVLDDAKDDPDVWHSIDVTEKELKRICGKYYVPRNIRYRGLEDQL